MYPARGVFINLAYVHRREFVVIADCKFLRGEMDKKSYRSVIAV